MLTREERGALFRECFISIRNANYATGWFFHALSQHIRRENVVEWILWALFSSTQDSQLAEWDEEIQGYIHVIEKLLGHRLEDGYNDEIKCMKVSMDPVLGVHRPLIWYMVRHFYEAFVLLYHNQTFSCRSSL